LFILSCQNSDDLTAKSKNQTDKTSKSQTSKALAPCGPLYALVLKTGGTGTPVVSADSFIFKVDLCTSPVFYGFVSQIKVGAIPLTAVTGICDLPGDPDHLYATTGQNSNFPKKLYKVKIATGQATLVCNTTDFLQDIEMVTPTYFVAVKEASSQLMKVDIPSGICTAISPAGPLPQYNGLTLVGSKLHAISGNTSAICSSTMIGDIFEYNLGGGNYVGKYSYKAPTGVYTMKELGFYFDNCCGKNWVVGSAQGIISNNLNVTPCTLPVATFLLNAATSGQNYWNIYDFAVKL
jgi:hypothetical protein